MPKDAGFCENCGHPVNVGKGGVGKVAPFAPAGSENATAPGGVVSRIRGVPARYRLMALMGVLALAVAVVVWPLFGGGPASVANRFISATRAQNYVEARGYLGEEFSDGNGDDGGNTSALMPESAKADFRVAEQSDTTAKVVSRSDSRSYVLLNKVDGNWKISEISFTFDETRKEPVSFEQNYTDDPNAWEGQDTVATRGVDGEATVKVTIQLDNGQSQETGKQQVSVDVQPVTETGTRGTKPRSSGWATVRSTEHVNPDGSPLETLVRVTKVTQYSDGVKVEMELQSAISVDYSVFDGDKFDVQVAVEKPKNGVYGQSLDVARLENPNNGTSNLSDRPYEQGRPVVIAKTLQLTGGRAPELSEIVIVYSGDVIYGVNGGGDWASGGNDNSMQVIPLSKLWVGPPYQ